MFSSNSLRFLFQKLFEDSCTFYEANQVYQQVPILDKDKCRVISYIFVTSKHLMACQLFMAYTAYLPKISPMYPPQFPIRVCKSYARLWVISLNFLLIIAIPIEKVSFVPIIE